MKIRKNDIVIITTGKDKGKKGKVRRVFPKEGRVIIEGHNMIKRHSRAQKSARQGGIIELEAPLQASNVMFMCSKCGEPARISFHILADGKKVRICNSCQEVID